MHSKLCNIFKVQAVPKNLEEGILSLFSHPQTHYSGESLYFSAIIGHDLQHYCYQGDSPCDNLYPCVI